jgi:hydrocephalus-inducing protein
MHRIFVEGEVERPICHFELPFVNFDNQLRVIEISSLGYNSRTLKKFYVLNPTALGYSFNWEFDHQNSSYIKCLTPKGTILSGKKFEMIFEFTPTKNTPDKIEKQFTFVIPTHKLKNSFLLKTVILQPKIFFSKAKIDFGPLLLSGKGKETVFIKNLDEKPYHFHF